MLTYKDYKSLHLYTNSLFLPLDMTNKTSGNLIYLNTQSVDESLYFLNRQKNIVSNMEYYNSYFIESMFRMLIFKKNVLRKDIKSQTDAYLKIKNGTKYIKKTYIKIHQYKSKNIFIDLSNYNQIFNELVTQTNKEKSPLLVINEYLRLLNIIEDKYKEEYNDRYMLFDLDILPYDATDGYTFNKLNTSTPLHILINLMRYRLEDFNKLNFGIIIVKNRSFIKIVPSECNEESFTLLKPILMRMARLVVNNNGEVIDTGANVGNNQPSISVNSNIGTSNKGITKETNKHIDVTDLNNEKVIIDNINKTKEALQIKDIIRSNTRNFIGEDDAEDIKVENIIDKTVSESSSDKEAIDKLNANKDFIESYAIAKNNRLTNIMTPGNMARNRELAKKQAKIKYDGRTIDSIISENNNKEVTEKKLVANTINKEMTSLKLPNFDKLYNDKIYDNDMISIINFFKSRSIPVYILDVKKEDTSDEFNKKFTWTVNLESADRQRHKLVFDVPKFVNDSFMFFNGNKKNIYKQFVLLPISKTANDTVQICTNYNKVFLTRMGDKLSPKLERAKKCIPTIVNKNIVIKRGDNSFNNKKYKTTMEFDELAKMFMYIDLKQIKLKFMFDIDETLEYMKKNNIKCKDIYNSLPIAIENNKVIYLDLNKEVIEGTDTSFADFVIESIDQAEKGFKDNFLDTSTGKRFMYTKAKVVNKDIPLVLLLSYLEGLSTVLSKGKIAHTFSDTRITLKGDDKNNKGIIEFADGYLIYDKYPLRNSLLLNALQLIPTKEYNYDDFDSKEVYLDIFDDLLGMRKITNALDNYYDLLFDPITIEVLEDMLLPTDFVEIFLHANSLLEDNMFNKNTDLNMYRLRSNEVASAMTYKCLATAYEGYRLTAGNRTPNKMSIPRDKILKELQTSITTVEDYSSLNPALEAEKLRAVSFKGLSGMNLERAYTIQNRAYDKSMLGLVAMSSSPTGSVGLVRQLPLDCNVNSTRGYLHVSKSEDDLKNKNLFTPAELLVATGAQRDDPQRVAMTSVQTKHVVPCRRYDKLLIGNGTDKVLSEIISDDFAFKAKDDGEIVDVDNNTNTLIVKYKNGEYDVVELDTKILKNGGGGYYIANKLSTNYKLGDKVKKGEVIAVNKKFFKQNKGEAVYKSGTLTKIALFHGYYTYEDSSMVGEGLCDDMSTTVIQKKNVVLGPNSNIEYIANIGDRVEVGSNLLVFDISYEDEGINKMLAGLDSGIRDSIEQGSKKPVKSKYSGVIEDIKVYYTVDEDQLSSSLRKTINKLNKTVNEKRKFINKYIDVNKTNVVLPPTSKINTPDGKVKGVDVGEGVCIEFYIKYNDKLKVGDKITFFTALKSVTCETIPKGLEPYTVDRPEEKIQAILSPSSVLKRMTTSIFINMYGNKVLIELKRKCKDIFEE